MGIIPFTFDSSLTERFVDFGYELYRGDRQWIPPLRKDLGAQLDERSPFYTRPGNDVQHFMATAGQKSVGRITAFVNRDLQDTDGTPIGTFGFFECVDEYSVANELLANATEWLGQQHGIRRIWGPMNFDIWHDYRVMTKGFDQHLFYGEPYNKPYYPKFFTRFGFVPRHRWDSVEISGKEALRQMIVRGAKRHKLLVDRGYRFEHFQPAQAAVQIKRLHHVLSTSFAQFPGFTAIPLTEFSHLFERYRQVLDPRLVLLAYDENNELGGFGVGLLELGDAVRAMAGRDNLAARARFLYHRRQVDRINFYIGGVTQKEIVKRSGLGRAGFYYVINQALQLGYDTLLLTLRLQGNRAHALLTNNHTEPQREYALFELNR